MDARDDLDALLRRASELDNANNALRERNRALEARIARTPSEAELNRARLDDALQRERDEEAARERAKHDEAALQTAHGEPVPRAREVARTTIVGSAFVGSVVSGAAGSLLGIGAVIGVAAVILFIFDRD